MDFELIMGNSEHRQKCSAQEAQSVSPSNTNRQCFNTVQQWTSKGSRWACMIIPLVDRVVHVCSSINYFHSMNKFWCWGCVVPAPKQLKHFCLPSPSHTGQIASLSITGSANGDQSRTALPAYIIFSRGTKLNSHMFQSADTCQHNIIKIRCTSLHIGALQEIVCAWRWKMVFLQFVLALLAWMQKE